MDAAPDGDRVLWSATSPATGSFDVSGSLTDLAALQERFTSIRNHGEGYAEVSRGQASYPCLTLGFRGTTAVLQAFWSPDAMAVMVGDDPTRPDVVVPVMDEDALFSGSAALDVDRAWRLVVEFLAGRSLRAIGSWDEL